MTDSVFSAEPLTTPESPAEHMVPGYIYDSLLRSYQAERAKRTSSQFLESICQFQEEMLAELRHLRAALGSSSDSRSSIEVKTSTRGVDIASKAYEGSSTDGLVDLAVANYFDTLDKVQQRLNGGSA